eukprot:gene11208-13711_t
MLQGADTDPTAIETVRAAIRRGEGCQVVIKNYRRDGTTFWNHLTISPVHDAEDVLTHFVGIQDDVSAQHETAENLRVAKETGEAANRELARAARMKDEFLAAMSHDLRTPLNAILGFSEILLAGMFGPVGSPKYEEYAKDIHESGKHLLNVINDILDFSKIEHGKLEIEERVFEIESLAETTASIIRGRADEHGNT